jgi:hypothetical protein
MVHSTWWRWPDTCVLETDFYDDGIPSVPVSIYDITTVYRGGY